MHLTAFQNASRFQNAYASGQIDTLVEVGSQIVAGQQSLRPIFKNATKYLGIDFQDATGVDIVIKDPYQFPLPDGSANVVLSSSCFEHSEFFWLTFLEICRICRSPGLIYLNLPSDGPFHQYPVDCWRFYPDSGKALEKWAKRNGYAVTLLESYISDKGVEPFSDTVCVFCKGADATKYFPHRITDTFREPMHIHRFNPSPS